MVKVAVIEDHQVLVDALELFMHTNSGLKFVGSAGTLESGRRLVERSAPDVLLLDVGLPDGDGIDLIPMVKQACPDTQVVVLTRHTDEHTLMRAVEKGASGFVSKSSSLPELVSTVERAAEGEIVMPTSMLVGLLRRVPRDKAVVGGEDEQWEQLTPREQEILKFLAEGKSGVMIAGALHIAPMTVRTHIRNMMSKLGVHSRLEAVAFGLRNGIIDTPE